MMPASTSLPPTLVKKPGGIYIAGTRITLYQIMDCLLSGWDTDRICQMHKLTEQQMTDLLTYLQVHRSQCVSEYLQVLQESEENRRYWKEQQQERLAQIAAMPPRPGQEALRAKIQEWKAKRFSF